MVQIQNKATAQYANGLSVVINPIEAGMFFAVETPYYDEEGKNTGIVRNIVADIRMHPVLAKQLLKTLTDSIKSYEEKYGEIVLPETEVHDLTGMDK